MKKVLFYCCVLFYSTSILSQNKSDHSNSSKDNLPNNVLISIVISVLSNKDLQQMYDFISPEAYIILDNKYESLFEVLRDKITKEKLLGNLDQAFQFMRLWLSDDQKTAYLIIESKGDNKSIWHTILFTKKENNNWQIVNWHRS